MKRIHKIAATAAFAVAAAGLGGCATGFPAKVSRYNAMPAPAGQSFYVVSADPSDAGSLQFNTYAGMVANALRSYGYAPAPSPAAATMIVKVDYGVDEGTQEVRSYPSSMHGYGYGYGYSPFHNPWYYPRFGYYGRHYSPFYYGWDDPFWYGRDIDTYTVYKSFLDVDIRRRADNAALFEGHAKARSGSDDLNKIVPNLVTAMFTGFPGRSGENVKITVPPERTVKGARAGY